MQLTVDHISSIKKQRAITLNLGRGGLSFLCSALLLNEIYQSPHSDYVTRCYFNLCLQQGSRDDRVSREANMAAPINTPRKKVDKNCFLCEVKKRHFNVCDYKDGILINKICGLTGEDRHYVFDYCSSERLGVCRVCNERVTKAVDLVEVLKGKLMSEETSARYKRMAVSPVTPKKGPIKRRTISVKKSLNLAGMVLTHFRDLINNNFTDHRY